jgi:hypothetical protein
MHLHIYKQISGAVILINASAYLLADLWYHDPDKCISPFTGRSAEP